MPSMKEMRRVADVCGSHFQRPGSRGRKDLKLYRVEHQSNARPVHNANCIFPICLLYFKLWRSTSRFSVFTKKGPPAESPALLGVPQQTPTAPTCLRHVWWVGVNSKSWVVEDRQGKIRLTQSTLKLPRRSLLQVFSYLFL